jgi:hypothetical protein
VGAASIPRNNRRAAFKRRANSLRDGLAINPDLRHFYLHRAIHLANLTKQVATPSFNRLELDDVARRAQLEP